MNRQQIWAKEALERVQGARRSSAAGKYKSACMRGPSLIRQAGAVQGLSFLLAKSHTRAFAEDVAAIYSKTGESDFDGAALLNAAMERDVARYLALTRDLLEIACWLRRMAQIELSDIKEEEE